MKKLNFITFVILSFILASLLSSCTSSDEEVIVVRDTVVIKVQPPIKNQISIETINKKFAIQLAAFNREENVNTYVKQAKEKLGETPEIRKYGNLFVVTVGIYNYANDAQDYLTVVKSKGFKDAFVKAID